MNVKVIGEGCPKCAKLYENVLEALEGLGIEAEVEKVQSLLDIVKLGVTTSPAVMVDDKLVVSGRVSGVNKLKKIFEEYK